MEETQCFWASNVNAIRNKQRPDGEAEKRKAQLEWENAAKYSSLGKVQYLIEGGKEMEISRYYGYAQ